MQKMMSKMQNLKPVAGNKIKDIQALISARKQKEMPFEGGI